MSRASKLTLAGCSLFALSTVVFVHYAQQAEKSVRPLRRPLSVQPDSSPVTLLSRDNSWYPFHLPCRGFHWADPLEQAMHAGVIRDMEQQRIKRERQADFEMQRALEQEYKKVQTVHDGGGPEAIAGGRLR